MARNPLVPSVFLTFSILGLAAFGAIPADKTVGASTCEMCHPDVASAFLDGPHGRAMARRSKDTLERACESCHGPGARHADDPSTKNITRKPKPSACLSCHTERQGELGLSTPGHDRNGAECLDCHVSGHSVPAAAPLLAKTPSKLCATCHADKAASFLLPRAHREGSKPFACTTCHTVHGDTRKGGLWQAHNGGVCIDCHTEKAGPFVFPHPPREIDGCVTCHEPHGSVNPYQLTRHRVSDLCLECHTDVPSFHDLTKAKYRSCQACHASVHGSNRNPALFGE